MYNIILNETQYILYINDVNLFNIYKYLYIFMPFINNFINKYNIKSSLIITEKL